MRYQGKLGNESFEVVIDYAKIWAKRHAELIPSLNILHARLLGRIRSIRAYIIYGVVRNSDCSMPILFTGGVDGGRGWKGDVKNMLLDVNKLKSLGWKPKPDSKQAIKKATQHLITELQTI